MQTLETRRGESTVADAMILAPKVCGPETTVAEAAAVLRNEHVHAVLVVDGSALLAVVERADLAAPPGSPARRAGRLGDRVTGPDADLETARQAMRAAGRRRLAVVDAGGALLGLLCLKRSGLGFCSDDGIRARAAERRRTGAR
ncbi:CBS domain-containing protein [Actinocorallia sp. A-T 12471]|uniref:CBS domain-containing protein n=1 Tax=Actinocorallia sp. A-T 12471 TaxID=3089813 RepID=UPI0029CB34B2|nr:CBS domain-containing protein [Actinocorallia sp. A-T 12471]MDX6740911.1 CBS domain-containing protein [Actinocorallia sp. A-T 12471]